MSSDTLRSVPDTRFVERRRRVFDALDDGVLVLPSGSIRLASPDTGPASAPDRELYYLTGLTEPGTVAVFVGGAEPTFVLFVRERDAGAELWDGPRLGPEGAAEVAGPDACLPLSELRSELPGHLAVGRRIFYRLGSGADVDGLVLEALARGRARGSRTGSGPRAVVDPGELLDDLRMVKDRHELASIRHACAITVEGHRAGVDEVRPGVGEWVVEAAIEAAFRVRGATGPGFGTIVASGPNGCVLHYVDNGDRIGEADLVLIDAGAEAGMYHGDVTRTYPASGRFTAAQRDVYELVDAARTAAIEVARAGVTIKTLHDAACRVLTDGLLDLGVLDGGVSELLEAGAYKSLFPHQTSHWLGLDVHDPGDYARRGASRTLEPGMVFTVEPGLYFHPERVEGRAADFAGIGIRLEDDVAITDEGCEVLTSSLPTEAAEVEAMLNG